METKNKNLVKCVGCGIVVGKENVDKFHWRTISKEKNLYCCCNCDLTVVDKQNA